MDIRCKVHVACTCTCMGGTWTGDKRVEGLVEVGGVCGSAGGRGLW